MERVSLNEPLDACGQCTHKNCCTEVEPFGGLVAGPFLTDYDIARISMGAGIRKGKFVHLETNPITLNTIKLIKTSTRMGCTFLDRETNDCTIHDSRPLDCRLFPFDVLPWNGRYIWILYDRCNMREEQIRKLWQSAKIEIFPRLSPDLWDYANLPMGLTDQGVWQYLGDCEVYGKILLAKSQ